MSDGNGEGVAVKLARKDFQSDQEVRWCPGCGDYSILTAVQMLLPELDVKPEELVFVSGIGCSGRFTYYMDTYGFHGIHGRALPFATGVSLSRPDLQGRDGLVLLLSDLRTEKIEDVPASELKDLLTAFQEGLFLEKHAACFDGMVDRDSGNKTWE